MLTSRMGGAAAPASVALASSVAYGQASIAAFLVASCMAKARQVGTPHSPQLVFGSTL